VLRLDAPLPATKPGFGTAAFEFLKNVFHGSPLLSGADIRTPRPRNQTEFGKFANY
jgi:hypothetical protein